MTDSSRSSLAAEPDDARYLIEQKLGEGGAGAVYLVRDRETGEQLALKKLFRVDAKSVLRLKREFRSIQAINHPHIVKLYDMGQARDSWFLTMEYLDGVDLSTYLTREDRRQSTQSSACGRHLLSAFRQLARGIHALHEAGMLHRDLKPSNVLVVEHRVVVLDFGLVRELSMNAASVTEDGALAGTPAYMAPEQIMAKELTAATDWYAFGAMLYEAVSGCLPVEGSLLELMRQKLEADPPALAELVPEAPAWLTELCSALLHRDPRTRPLGAEVLARFEAAEPDLQPPLPLLHTQTENVVVTEAETRGGSSQLFGRSDELARLRRAVAQAEDGRAVVVHVRGASGTGKSALVEHFLAQLGRERAASMRADALVLRSRCYELEAMPFKALDGVMDALTRHLSLLDDLDVAHLLPADIGALAQLFPVLARLDVVKRLCADTPTRDALQRRRRAESALRELLDNLATRTPIVLWIEDLQWGDLDSARILRSWIAQPSAAPLLYVLSYRSDEVATSSCLRRLLDEEAATSGAAPEHVVELEALAGADIRALCEERLPAHARGRAELIERVITGAQGSPFLASQLLALAAAKSARGDNDLGSLSIDLMVAQTSLLLSPDAHQLLVVLAVAGRPILPKRALQAAGIKSGGRGLIHDLRALNLVRTRDVGGQRMIEVYHDRIRERVQGALSSDESRRVHNSLFNTLEVSGQAEAHWLHALALGAGRDAEALRYGKAAAERASASLAFERAAGLYSKCIELVPQAERGELWGELALALARCGRGVGAADAALEAAKHASTEQAVAFMQRAASHFLRSGHFAHGEALVRQVLAAKKIAVPASKAGLNAAIAWERVRIKLLGTKDALRTDSDYPHELLERFDLLIALFIDTHSHDPLRAQLFQLRALRCALEAGEPIRLVRALGIASTAAALYGSAKAAEEADALLARAAAVNAELASPDEQTMFVSRAINAFGLGRLHDVLEPLQEAGRLFRSDSQEDPGGNYARRFGVASMRISTLQFLGEYAQCAGELRSLLAEAIATDNRGLSLRLTRNQTLAEQVAGQAAQSRARLDAQRSELPRDCFGFLHVVHLVSVMSTACWTLDYDWANAYLEHAWSEFLQSPARDAAYLGLMVHAEHAHFMLNQHVTERRSGNLAAAVAKDIRALERLPLPWAAAFAQRYRARIAFLAGRHDEATGRLRASDATFTEIGMRHEAARDRYALGVILGAGSAELREGALRRIHELGVASPQQDVRAHFPELREAEISMTAKSV